MKQTLQMKLPPHEAACLAAVHKGSCSLGLIPDQQHPEPIQGLMPKESALSSRMEDKLGT